MMLTSKDPHGRPEQSNCEDNSQQISCIEPGAQGVRVQKQEVLGRKLALS